MLSLPKIAGHRGAARYAPENTLAGLAMAQKLGCSWVEFDVMLSADAVAMLMHDETLERTTGDKRRLADIEAATAKSLDAGSWFGAAFKGESIPTFVETLEALGRLGLGANVEIKAAEGADADTARETVRLLQRHWPRHLPRPLVSSFSITSLEAARAADPELLLGYLVEELPGDWQNTAQRLGCVSVHPWHEPLTEQEARAIKAAGYALVTYTVNDAARAGELLSWGCDCLITDDPLALQKN